MIINLKCVCGASADLTDERGTFINSGGAPDTDGCVFQLELVAARWMKDHSAHAILCGPRAS